MSRQSTRKQDIEVVEGSHRCTYCRRVKPLDRFSPHRTGGRRDSLRSWCKSCERISSGLQEETQERKAWRKAYHARPDVQQRRREFDRRRNATPQRAAQNAVARLAYARTPRGKLLHSRGCALRRL